MGRKSISTGVTSKGPDRIQFDFRIDGVRDRPTLRRPRSTCAACDRLAGIKQRIACGTSPSPKSFLPIVTCTESTPPHPDERAVKSSMNLWRIAKRDRLGTICSAVTPRSSIPPRVSKVLARLEKILRPSEQIALTPPEFDPIKTSLRCGVCTAWTERPVESDVDALSRAQEFDTRTAKADQGTLFQMPRACVVQSMEIALGTKKATRAVSRGRPKESFGWGGRIRTYVWRDQNPLPYRLATPQYSRSPFDPFEHR